MKTAEFDNEGHEEIVAPRVANLSKEKFVPSPMQEESLPQPKEGHIVQRNEDEISRALTFDMNEVPPLNPQRAQLAFYRSQTEQIASYNPVD
ncbi:hypothetical protein TELCIR_03126 [Teladorsagia circumcincta]|uniref:Uncharacterized protein n=1 Tax=Teladorsagia circumcincta TaxID=45464 RepID=A0A2G9UX60_TELCI|nr:hypothetical protein TELCIR_03126 [Teladorsagia circumcincta]